MRLSLSDDLSRAFDNLHHAGSAVGPTPRRASGGGGLAAMAWGHPPVVGNRIFVKDETTLAALSI
ncbi:MAG TPA: hypothetical protein VF553_22985 [Pyrinomonadaceae bacterium]